MRRFNVLFLILFALSSYCMASNDSIMTLANMVNKFNRVFPQEKVYLHLDNTGYFKGERIWFKAYLTRTDKDSLGSLSKVLYVELVNPYGDIEKTLKLPITDGQANGDIELDELLNSGYYEIRAYTRYMLNWGTDAIFSRVIPIFEKNKVQGDYSKLIMNNEPEDRTKPKVRIQDDEDMKKLNVRFYPEGGKIIKGLPCRVAFVVTDKNGIGLHSTCQVLFNGSSYGKSITTNQEGRGIAEIGQSEGIWQLHIKTDKGRETTESLPQAEDTGCTLSTKVVDKGNMNVTIACSPDLYEQNIGIAWLNNGHMYDCKVKTLCQGKITINYDRSILKSGVNQITIIDEKGEILANRLVFLYPTAEVMPISIQPKYTVGKRYINLVAKTLPNTNFSISVMDASSQTNGWNANAATWLLLTSDLKGYISNPEYYLEKDDNEHRAAADLLMMVQGWKRYDFKMMEGKANFNFMQPVEKSLMIDGKLKKRSRKNDVADVDLSVLLINKFGDRLDGRTTTDKRGNYAFALPDCYRNWTMILLTAKDEKYKNYYVGINRHFSPSLRSISPLELQPIRLKMPTFILNEYVANKGLTNDKNAFVLQEVKVLGKRYSSARKAWESESRGAINASIRYDCAKEADNIIDRGEDVPTLIDFLKSKNHLFAGNDNLSGIYGRTNYRKMLFDDGLSYDRMPIIWVVNNRFLGGTSFMKRGTVKSKAEDVNLSSEATELSGAASDETTVYFPTSLDEVKRVYVSFGKNDWRRFISDPDLMGSNIVTVFVYTSESAGVKSHKGVRLTYFDGFNVASSYNEEMLAGVLSSHDYRRTLYWNPDVRTDNEGKALIEFTNNTNCKSFIISAEGVTKDAKAICY